MKEPRVRVAGILIKEGKMLFIEHGKKGKRYWLLPGGGVDYGESFEEALKREFREEVNLDIEVLNLKFISEAIAPDGSKHIINMFFIVKEVGGSLKMAKEDRIVGLEYLEISNLNNYIIYPNIKNELIKLEDDNNTEIKYIGNIWED